jgi:hypothetical protein
MCFLEKIVSKIYRLFIYYYIKRNIFKNSHKERVLISYLVLPFFYKHYRHTNNQEVHAIAKAFNNLGFIVDVVDYRFKGKINYSNYSLLFGFGNVLENSFYEKKFEGTRVVYGTGSHFNFQNTRTTFRLFNFYEKYKKLFPGGARFAANKHPLQWSFFDYLFLLGNEFTAKTYQKNNNNISLLPVSFINTNTFKIEDIYQKKEDAMKNFLYFSGSGCLHKGLDLLFEYFSKNQKLKLHVCGLNKADQEIFDYLFEYYGFPGNIQNYGFVNLNSNIFKELMLTCSFCLLPSCSEGQSSAVVNLMANGALVPIVSPQVGLPSACPSIVIGKELTFEDIESAIGHSQRLSFEAVKELSRQVYSYVFENHSLDIFQKKIEQNILKISKGDQR